MDQQDLFDPDVVRSLLDQLLADARLYTLGKDYKELLDFVRTELSGWNIPACNRYTQDQLAALSGDSESRSQRPEIRAPVNRSASILFFRRDNGIIEGPKYFPGSVLRESENVHAAVLGFDLYLAVSVRSLEPPRGTHKAKIPGALELFEFWDPFARLLRVGELVAITFLKIRFLRVWSALEAEVYVISEDRHRSG